jgi:hypothetical protein
MRLTTSREPCDNGSMDMRLRGWQALQAVRRAKNVRVPTTVQVPEQLHSALVKEASRRNLGLTALIDLLLQKIVQDDLFEAIIDGDEVPSSIA